MGLRIESKISRMLGKYFTLSYISPLSKFHFEIGSCSLKLAIFLPQLLKWLGFQLYATVRRRILTFDLHSWLGLEWISVWMCESYLCGVSTLDNRFLPEEK